MTLKILAVVLLGLMCGSELNVAVFAHPTFNRQSLEVHIPMRASFAKLFGQVMPFWMGGSTLLSLLLLLPFEHLNDRAWQLAAVAAAIQVVAPADLIETTRKLAEKIASKSAVALRQAKAALRAAFTMEEDAGLRFEQEAFGVVFGSADRVEGTSAFVEKRPPKWQHK